MVRGFLYFQFHQIYAYALGEDLGAFFFHLFLQVLFLILRSYSLQ